MLYRFKHILGEIVLINKCEFLIQRQKTLDIFVSEVYGDILPSPKKYNLKKR